MLINPDFSEATSPNQPGIYICRIESAELKRGQTSGAPYLNWKLFTYPDKKIVFHTTMLTGKGSGMLKHLIHCAGDTSYDSGAYDTDKLVGKMISMKLGLNDSGYFVVKAVYPLSAEQNDMLYQESLAAIQSKSNEDIPF